MPLRPGGSAGTQSFWPTPTGPLVIRKVGMARRGRPGTCRAPRQAGSSGTTPGPPTSCWNLSASVMAASSAAARASGVRVLSDQTGLADGAARAVDPASIAASASIVPAVFLKSMSRPSLHSVA